MVSGALSAVKAGTGRMPALPVSWLDLKLPFDLLPMASMDQVCMSCIHCSISTWIMIASCPKRFD